MLADLQTLLKMGQCTFSSEAEVYEKTGLSGLDPDSFFASFYTDKLTRISNRMSKVPVSPQSMRFTDTDKATANSLYENVYTHLPVDIREMFDDDPAVTPFEEVPVDRLTGFKGRSFSEITHMCNLIKGYYLDKEFFVKTVSLMTCPEKLTTEYSFFNFLLIHKWLHSPECEAIIKSYASRAGYANYVQEIRDFINEYDFILSWFAVEDFHNFYIYMVSSATSKTAGGTHSGFITKDLLTGGTLRLVYPSNAAPGYKQFIQNTYQNETNRMFDTDMLYFDFCGCLFCPPGRVPFKTAFTNLTSFAFDYVYRVSSALSSDDFTDNLNSSDELMDFNFVRSYPVFRKKGEATDLFKWKMGFTIPVFFENHLIKRIYSKRCQVFDLINPEVAKMLDLDVDGSVDGYLSILKAVEIMKQTFWGIFLQNNQAFLPSNSSVVLMPDIKEPVMFYSTTDQLYISVKETPAMAGLDRESQIELAKEELKTYCDKALKSFNSSGKAEKRIVPNAQTFFEPLNYRYIDIIAELFGQFKTL